MSNKKFCPTHRYNYLGDVCPFCEKERLERLAKRYDKSMYHSDTHKDDTPQAKSKQMKREDRNSNRPASRAELNALMEHFSSNSKK